MDIRRAAEWNLLMAIISKPKPVKQAKEKKPRQRTNRQKLVAEISNLCREITKWRDGCICVLSETDGARCNQVSQWGHVVAQGSSGYLKHSLSNSFRQCGSHNKIHNGNPLIYCNWYRDKFGTLAMDMLETASKRTYHKFSIPDLWYMRDNLKALLHNTNSMVGATLPEMIDAGYYGEIIREAWIKDGRI